jgi:hypothetical protein
MLNGVEAGTRGQHEDFINLFFGSKFRNEILRSKLLERDKVE